MCSAEWMVKPAALVMNGVGSTAMAVHVDLDQAGGGHLLEHQLIGIEQEMMLRPRHARGEVGEDQIVPAIISDQPVGGGEIDADLPLLRR